MSETLADLREAKDLVPATSNVLVKLDKVEVVDTKKDGSPADFKYLKVNYRLVDGIEVLDSETGEMTLKYKNKVLFSSLIDFVYWADLTVKTSKWWKSKQFLVGLKKFLPVFDVDLKNVQTDDNGIVDINPILAQIDSMKDVAFFVNITHEANTVVSPEGERVKDGTFREKVVGWRKA